MIKVKEFRGFGLVWLVFFVYNNEGERDYGAILADIKLHNDLKSFLLNFTLSLIPIIMQLSAMCKCTLHIDMRNVYML